jgi:hypothetical protein
MKLSQQLLEKGFHVPAIRPPTVPAGTCRLRISLSAAHSREDVERLVGLLKGFNVKFTALEHLKTGNGQQQQQGDGTVRRVGSGGADRAMLPRPRL